MAHSVSSKSRPSCHSFKVRGKNKLKYIKTILKATIFYGVWKSRPFLPCYVTTKKRAGNSNSIKNRVLESCSNIFFTLGNQMQRVHFVNKFQKESHFRGFEKI